MAWRGFVVGVWSTWRRCLPGLLRMVGGVAALCLVASSWCRAALALPGAVVLRPGRWALALPGAGLLSRPACEASRQGGRPGSEGVGGLGGGRGVSSSLSRTPQRLFFLGTTFDTAPSAYIHGTAFAYLPEAKNSTAPIAYMHGIKLACKKFHSPKIF